MNEGDDQAVRCLGICNWLYNLITKTISTQTLKTVTLGQTQPADSMSHDATKSESKTDTEQRRTAAPCLLPASDYARKKGPKKSVSINEKVEEMVEYNKRKTSLKLLLPGNRRSVSMDLLEDKLDGKRPLKSILKVKKGDNLLARSASFG